MITCSIDTLFCLYQRVARDEAIPSQSEITQLREDLNKKDELIKALLDESVDQATQLGLRLGAEKETLAKVTEQLEESEKKRAAAESALAAIQLKFPGNFYIQPSSCVSLRDSDIIFTLTVAEEKLKNIGWNSSSLKVSARRVCDLFWPDDPTNPDAESIIIRLSRVANELKVLKKATAENAVLTTLTLVKSHYPSAKLASVAKGKAVDCTKEMMDGMSGEIEEATDKIVGLLSL